MSLPLGHCHLSTLQSRLEGLATWPSDSRGQVWAAKLAKVQSGAAMGDLAAAGAASEGGFTFADEGTHVEVRIPLPPAGGGDAVAAAQVGVDSQDDSLLVTLATEAKLLPLLVARPLYSTIHVAETVWYLEEGEVVVSLKKANADLAWPGLVEEFAAMGTGVGRLLKSCSVNVVGPRTDANWAVAQELARAMGHVPLNTQQLVEQLAGGLSIPQLIEAEGPASVAEAEGAVLRSLATNVRCVVATMGGPHGAAATSSGWASLHAGICVWLSCAEQEDGAEAELYGRSDLRVAVPLPGGAWQEDATRPAAEGALKALKRAVEDNPKLPGNKSLYVKLGCRGDWPDIQPPGWAPPSSPTVPGTAREVVL